MELRRLVRRGCVVVVVVLICIYFGGPLVKVIYEALPRAVTHASDTAVPHTAGQHHTEATELGTAHTETPPCPQQPCPQGADTLPVNYRRRMAFTLSEVCREVSRLAGTTAVVDAKWVLKLRALVAELVPQMVSKSTSWDYSARIADMGPAPLLSNRTRHVCPEMYLGHGMEPEKCTHVPLFASVLTVVLPALSWPPHTINFVIGHIRKWYKIPILVIVPKTVVIHPKLRGVKVLKANGALHGGDLLNKAMKLVTTPYVLVGTGLAHFSNQSSLERLVRVLDELQHVKVAGGAARDLQGHWTHGCLQQRMADYQATYTLGYYHSKYECMYCDDMITPFVTSAEFVKKVAFTSGLSGPAVYRDWFAKVREAGHLAMVCPDVMFFLTDHVNMTSEDWLPVAHRWALQKVSYNGNSFTFSCEAVNISCNNVYGITRSFLLPPCCVAEAVEQLHLLMDFAQQHGLQYELQSGSVLGAVKFGSFLPWDMDQDIYIECKDFKTWYKKFGAIAKTRNCLPKIRYKKIFLKIVCPSFTLDIFCRNGLSRQFLPAEYFTTPTTIWYSGRWATVSANPGLFTRNSLGLEDLKHLQHSAHLSVANFQGHPGTWLACRTPQHHSCLDRFPADGNLPFSFDVN